MTEIEKECMQLLNRLLVDQYDYNRMMEHDCSHIDKSKTYLEFVEWNVTCLKEYCKENCSLFKNLCDKIIQQKIGQMDMESCAVFKTSNLLFDKNNNLVIVNPR